ncbi:MAG: hypothetical protein C4539_08720 [Ignavibacteriales bacterium]|nr:MAG: hypothetical protein C4539_08720 [Ignavibacteriales bacterium]
MYFLFNFILLLITFTTNYKQLLIAALNLQLFLKNPTYYGIVMKSLYTIFRLTCIAILVTTINICFAQGFEINKIEPPNWWAGMKTNKINLMVYGKNLTEVQAQFSSPGSKVVKINKAENTDYIFIDAEIGDIADETNKIIFTSGNDKVEFAFPVCKRENADGRYGGFSQKDVIYLIMPDRFSDGDITNNTIEGLVDKYNPESRIGRHGGDIKGILNHLDYIKDLGCNTIWMTPLTENNMGISYHGYAVTDHYKIDARFGSNKDYFDLVKEAHQKGLKIILDHVANHIGINHPWMKNLPFPDWINGDAKNFHTTSHHNSSYYDINSDEQTREYSNTGWFVKEMPDLNPRNPFLAKYLIQNTIWWIESSGLDGIREDTYPYGDQKFLAEWAKTILEEYPDFNIVGEVWIGDPAFRAPFQKGSRFPKEFDSNLPAVTDFGFQEACRDVFANDKSIRLIYELIAKDNLYADPANLVTFVDNHDIERLIFSTNGNLGKTKQALALLLTTRGIPQILYGTEIGLMGGKDHGALRQDFPGGFPNDNRNAFNKDERTEQENDIFNFTKKVLEIRNNFTSIQDGKLIHYPPKDEVYYYFRVKDRQKILVVINNNKNSVKFNPEFISYQFENKVALIDLMNGDEIKITDGFEISLEANGVRIFEVKAHP